MSLLKNINQAGTVRPAQAKETAVEFAVSRNSLIRELSIAQPHGNTQTLLKKSDGSDAGTYDVIDKATSADDIGFSLMRNTINSDGKVSGSDVTDYIERAEELNDEVDTVPFGLETDDGKIVKVYVNAGQADQFEEAMKNMLGLEDDIEEAINRLAAEFDIVDVVWPESEDADESDEDDPDADLSIDDTSNLIDDEDDEDFSDDNYDVIASEADDESEQENDEDESDKDESDKDESDKDESDKDESDDTKTKKKKKAKPAEPSDDEDVKEALNAWLNDPQEDTTSVEENPQEKNMTIGSKFLARVIQEASEDRDGVKDGFNIPLDSQQRALAAKMKLPFAKRLVAFHAMVGIPGRYLNTKEVETGLIAATDMIRKQVQVRRAFQTLYTGLASAKGFNIPEDDVVKEDYEMLDEAVSKRGDAIQKLFGTVLVKLGLPESFITTSGPSAIGLPMRRTSKLIGENSDLERALRLLATRLGIKPADAQKQIEEAVDFGNLAYSQAVSTLLQDLGVPDEVFSGGRITVTKRALIQKGRSLRNRTQILTMIKRLQDLLNSSNSTQDQDE